MNFILIASKLRILKCKLFIDKFPYYFNVIMDIRNLFKIPRDNNDEITNDKKKQKTVPDAIVNEPSVPKEPVPITLQN